MKNSLFWRILLLGVIPFLFILIAAGIISISPVSDWHQENPSLFWVIGLIVYVSAAFAVSKKYIRSFNWFSRIIDDPSLLMDLRTFKGIPREVREFFTQINRKVTLLRNANVKLVSDKKMFDSTLKNMNDGIFIVDENEMVTLINPSACRIFGIDRQQAIDHTLAEALRNHKINELYQCCRESGQQEMMSFEIAPQKAYIQCIATPLDPELTGNILFLLQDLTRIRQLEIVRRDFVSNVSHELRTPLASLKLIAETLQEGALNDPPAAKRFLERMDNEIDNLTQMVGELLELSRIESGRVPLERKWIQPSELINRANERMALQGERAGLIIQTTIQDGLPSIFIDPPRMEQVLVNLVHNAIKFTNPGGKITINAERGNNEIIFHVIDSGIGIPPKDLERIFERFYKTDRSRAERGTGLGLSISRHLVEAHNGKIWAKSEPGAGSTFSFSIPTQ